MRETTQESVCLCANVRARPLPRAAGGAEAPRTRAPRPGPGRATPTAPAASRRRAHGTHTILCNTVLAASARQRLCERVTPLTALSAFPLVFTRGQREQRLEGKAEAPLHLVRVRDRVRAPR